MEDTLQLILKETYPALETLKILDLNEMTKEKISSYKSMISLWERKLAKAKNKSQRDWVSMQINSLKEEIKNAEINN